MVEEGVFNGSLSQMDGYPFFFSEGLVHCAGVTGSKIRPAPINR